MTARTCTRCGVRCIARTVEFKTLRDHGFELLERMDDGSLMEHYLLCDGQAPEPVPGDRNWHRRMNDAHWRDYRRTQRTGKRRLTG